MHSRSFQFPDRNNIALLIDDVLAVDRRDARPSVHEALLGIGLLDFERQRPDLARIARLDAVDDVLIGLVLLGMIGLLDLRPLGRESIPNDVQTNLWIAQRTLLMLIAVCTCRPGARSV